MRGRLQRQNNHPADDAGDARHCGGRPGPHRVPLCVLARHRGRYCSRHHRRKDTTRSALSRWGTMAAKRTDEDELCAIHLRNRLEDRPSDPEAVRRLIVAGAEVAPVFMIQLSHAPTRNITRSHRHRSLRSCHQVRSRIVDRAGEADLMEFGCRQRCRPGEGSARPELPRAARSSLKNSTALPAQILRLSASGMSA